MTFEEYRAGKGDIPDRMLAWQVFGKGLENVGDNGEPIEIDNYDVGPDTLLARVDAAGLCFSDIKILKQGGDHPRLYGRDLKNNPIVMGHEVALTVVEVGDDYQGEYHVGDRFVVQADVYYEGTNLAFGYMLPGAFEQYTVLGPEILQGDDGVYLIPIQQDTGYAEAALSEPWACVLCAYRERPRTSLKSGGITWVIGTPGSEDYTYDLSGFEYAGSLPGTVYLTDVPEAPANQITSLCAAGGIAVEQTDAFAELDLDALFGDEGADDIFVLGNGNARAVQRAASKLADDGLFNLITAEPLQRPVAIDVGRIHYDSTFYQGTAGAAVAQSYVRKRGPELTADGKVLIIGGAGPMGQMHVQLAIEQNAGPKQIVVSDIDPERLGTVPQRFGDIAEENDKDLICVNPKELGEEGFDRRLREIAPEGFEDVVVMVPAPPLVTQGSKYLAEGGWLNIFAGIARGTTAELDLSDVALRGVRYTGTSGSSIDDLARALEMAETGELSTNRSVAAIGGIEAVHEGLDGVMNTVFTGKVVVYPQIQGLPLTPLAELDEVLPDVAEKLDSSGAWTREAERALIERFLD